jgi:hypothetical protein
LGLQLLGVVLQWLGTGEVELVLDDTLCARSGKKVSLASMHVVLGRQIGLRRDVSPHCPHGRVRCEHRPTASLQWRGG